MRSTPVLEALSTAIEAGADFAAARAAIDREDPLTRPFLRRALLRAYREALALADPSSGSAHLLRLAYLSAKGEAMLPELARDELATEQSYQAATAAFPQKRRWRRWPSLIAAVVVVGLVGGGVVLAGRGSPPPARLDALQKPGPPATGAYARGGVPDAGDPAVAQALAQDLPTFLIKLDRLARARREGAAPGDVATSEAEVAEARQRVLSAEAAHALGEPATRRLDEVLTRAREAADGTEASARVLGDRLLEAVGNFDDELAARGLGWFVDGDLIRAGSGARLTVLYSFAVERVTLFEAEGLQVRSLSLRRADRLNWTHTLLGFTRPHLRDAVVLLDPIERRLANVLAPALADGAKMPLFDDPPAGPEEPELRERVELRAGEAARAELIPPNKSRADVVRLAEPLARRLALFQKWQRALTPRRISLVQPEGMRMDPEAMRDLASVVPRTELAELSRIDVELAEPALVEVYQALRSLIVEAVEQHEVQHRLDYARRQRLPMPPALQAYVGPLEQGGEEQRGPSHALAELSAYLGELAREGRTPRVDLALTARFLFDRTLWGTAESYVALVVFDGLTRVLGTANRGPFVHDREIDRARAAEAWLELDRRPPAEVRRAARALWEEMFGTRLPELRRL